jgi:hypothetical protein
MLDEMADLQMPDYAWVRDYSRSKVAMAACITVSTGLSWEEALFAFGGDPEDETLPWSEEVCLSMDSKVAILAIDDAVLAVEYNGWHGSLLGVLLPLSRTGRAASVRWNVDSETKISMAEAGRYLCALDPINLHRRWGENPGVIDRLIEDLDFAAGAITEQSMVVMERFTGLRVTPEMVAGLDQWYTIAPVLED